MSEKAHPRLTVMQWRALALVNEKRVISKETLAHIMYGRQTAVPRCEELLEELIVTGLVETFGVRYMTSEKGDDYIENAIKPVKDHSQWTSSKSK